MGNQQSSPPPGEALISSVVLWVVWWQDHCKWAGINKMDFGFVHQVLVSLVSVGQAFRGWLSLRELKALISGPAMMRPRAPPWSFFFQILRLLLRTIDFSFTSQIPRELSPSSLLVTTGLSTQSKGGSIEESLEGNTASSQQWLSVGDFHSFIPSFYYSHIYW